MSADKGEQCVKRWTELHGVIASTAACTEAERDNLPVSEIKGEKAKSVISLAVCSTTHDRYFPLSLLCVAECET